MAFPQVIATANSSETSDVDTHDVSLPGPVQVGDLIIVLFSCDGEVNTFLTGGLAIQVAAVTLAGISFGLLAIRVTAANIGSIGASFQVVTWSVFGMVVDPKFEKSAHHAYLIRGSASGVLGIPDSPASNFIGFSGANGVSVSADPPALSPGWGLNDTLWITCAVTDQDAAFSADPASYGNSIENGTGGVSGTTGTRLRSLRRELAAESEDPGSFTNTNRNWIAATIGVRPTIALGGGRRAFMGG